MPITNKASKKINVVSRHLHSRQDNIIEFIRRQIGRLRETGRMKPYQLNKINSVEKRLRDVHDNYIAACDELSEFLKEYDHANNNKGGEAN